MNTAVDCGRYVNPQGVRKQIEGAAIDGNTVAQSGKNTTSDRAVVQSDFRDCPITFTNTASENARRAPGHAPEKYPSGSLEPSDGRE